MQGQAWKSRQRSQRRIATKNKESKDNGMEGMVMQRERIGRRGDV
jgi:hypothetical protein